MTLYSPFFTLLCFGAALKRINPFQGSMLMPVQKVVVKDVTRKLPHMSEYQGVMRIIQNGMRKW
jgi:hypothetical protein